MTMIAQSPPAFSRWEIAGRVTAFAMSQIARIHRRMRVRRARRDLAALPPYLLKDIGISHSDIASVTEFGLADPTRRHRR
jgi:uncharacterized protein YjiS (DUF1127 family)